MLPRLTYLIIIENNRNFKYTGTDTDTDERNTQLKCEFEQNAAEMIICADQIDLYYTMLYYALLATTNSLQFIKKDYTISQE